MKKKIIFSAFATLLVVNMFAITEQDAILYFRDCISNLDPIEGVYSMEVRSKTAQDNTSKTYTQVFNVYIVKQRAERDGRFLICDGDTDKDPWTTYFVLEKIGNTNSYRFIVYNEDNEALTSCHVILENGAMFTANIQQGYYYRGWRYEELFNASLQFSFIKSYPTYDMVMKEKTRQSTWYGTGFALNNGYFVSNYHVYANVDNTEDYQAKKIFVKGVNGDFSIQYKAVFITGDKDNDIAIFQIRDTAFHGFGTIPYTINPNMINVGDEVWTLGYPLTQIMGNEIKFTDGRINSRTGYQGKINFYQISIPLHNGNSGGPVFDQNGNIIGIATSGLRKDMTENVNYALKSTYLYTLLESSFNMHIVPKGQNYSRMSVAEKIKTTKPFVFQVVCSAAEEIIEAEPIEESILEEPIDTPVVEIVNIVDTTTKYIVENSIERVIPTDQYITKNDSGYYCGSYKLTTDEYEKLLRRYPKTAWDSYVTKKPAVGIALMSLGGATFITGISLISVGVPKINYGFVATGLSFVVATAALTVPGIILYTYCINQRENAHIKYNAELNALRQRELEEIERQEQERLRQLEKNKRKPDRQINLEVCQNGIGLVFHF